MHKTIMPFTLLVLILVVVVVLAAFATFSRKARQERDIDTEETIKNILNDKAFIQSLTTLNFANGVSIGPDEIEMMSVEDLQHLAVLITLCTEYSANAELTEMFGKKLLPLYFKQSYLAESGVKK